MPALLGVRLLDHPNTGRSVAALFLAQAAATSAITSSTALSSIVATDLTGSARFSGVPATLNMVAAAGAAFMAGQLMARRGRRLGLLAGYGLGAAGAALGCGMALAGSFPGFLVGSAMVGAANAVANQGRYAGAELVQPTSRGRVVGIILFGAVIGAALSWALSPAVQHFADRLRVPAVELGWGTSSVLLLAGGLILLFLFSGLSGPAGGEAPARNVPFQRLIGAAGDPRIRAGVLSLVIGQSVMAMLMTLVPVRLQHLGYSLPVVTAVITAHITGMFGFAWLTGMIVDRWGTTWSSAAGGLMIIGGAVLAAQQTSVVWLAFALFVIGLGWNYCFVAGSTMLARYLHPDVKVRFQGTTDVLVWLGAGTATLGGGYVVGTNGFSAAAVMGALLATAALLIGGAIIVRFHRAGAVRLSPAERL